MKKKKEEKKIRFYNSWDWWFRITNWNIFKIASIFVMIAFLIEDITFISIIAILLLLITMISIIRKELKDKEEKNGSTRI